MEGFSDADFETTAATTHVWPWKPAQPEDFRMQIARLPQRQAMAYSEYVERRSEEVRASCAEKTRLRLAGEFD